MKKVIGMDVGDKTHVMVVFEADGREVEVARVTNTADQVKKFFARHPGAVVAMEAGTHSPWLSRLLERMNHEVYVGNPRKLRAIWDADDKSDERDARMLGMICRLEPRLLHRVYHRGEQAQAHLEVIKARNVLVDSRTQMVNHVRGVVKAMGARIPKCSAESFPKRARPYLPEVMKDVIEGLVQTIEALTAQIRAYDRQIEELCEQTYPETRWVRQIAGVGPVTALAFVLTLEEPERFAKSRQVGAFLGLTPRRDQSGASDKQLRITKAGDPYVRKLLVSCAHYILGPFGPDSELRRYGLRLAKRGGKNAKKRATVAVARKLAVLMHRLWQDRAAYVPLRKAPAVAA